MLSYIYLINILIICYEGFYLAYYPRLPKGHEIRIFEDIMIIINIETKDTKINVLEEI